jgi:hypothetical protein
VGSVFRQDENNGQTAVSLGVMASNNPASSSPTSPFHII